MADRVADLEIPACGKKGGCVPPLGKAQKVCRSLLFLPHLPELSLLALTSHQRPKQNRPWLFFFFKPFGCTSQLWDLSFPTRNGTLAQQSKWHMASYQLDHRGIPFFFSWRPLTTLTIQGNNPSTTYLLPVCQDSRSALLSKSQPLMAWLSGFCKDKDTVCVISPEDLWSHGTQSHSRVWEIKSTFPLGCVLIQNSLQIIMPSPTVNQKKNKVRKGSHALS